MRNEDKLRKLVNEKAKPEAVARCITEDLCIFRLGVSAVYYHRMMKLLIEELILPNSTYRNSGVVIKALSEIGYIERVNLSELIRDFKFNSSALVEIFKVQQDAFFDIKFDQTMENSFKKAFILMESNNDLEAFFGDLADNSHKYSKRIVLKRSDVVDLLIESFSSNKHSLKAMCGLTFFIKYDLIEDQLYRLFVNYSNIRKIERCEESEWCIEGWFVDQENTPNVILHKLDKELEPSLHKNYKDDANLILDVINQKN